MSSAFAGHLRALARVFAPVCALVLALSPAPVAAQKPSPRPERPPVLVLRPGDARYAIGRPDSPLVRIERADSVQGWIVEFTAPPRLSPERRGGESPDVQHARFRTDLGRVEVEARRGLPSVQALPGSTIRYEYLDLLNGVAIRAPVAVARALRQLPYVRAVNEDRVVRLNLRESVPLIRADQVWTRLGYRGEGTVIAIIDTGIDYHHPALGAGFGPGYKVMGGWDFANNDADPMDDHGHGTHVAGIVAGSGDGVLGVAPNARLLAYKAFQPNGQGDASAVVAAFERAVDPDGNPATQDGADVINFSAGASGTPDDYLSRAADNAVAAGVVVVAGAGNDGPAYSTLSSPGAARGVIAVAASDKSDQVADFSSRGPTVGALTLKPDVSAPGVSIISAALGGGTKEMSGTSMATPHVAGVAALVRQAHRTWSPAWVKAAIMGGARDIGRGYFLQGTGRVDALRAVSPSVLVLPGSISLGAVGQGVRVARHDTLTVVNPGQAPRTYTLSFDGAPPGVSVSVAPTSLSLAPGDSARVYADFTVDGSSLPVGTYPYASEGRILVSTSDETTRVPYVVMAAQVASVRYDYEPYLSVVHDHRGHVVASYFPGSQQDVLLPRDATVADVIAQWGPRMVIKENYALGGAPLTLNYNDATIERRIQGRDERGAPVPLDSTGVASRLLYTGDSPVQLDMYGIGWPVSRFQFSTVSPAYRWDWAAVNARDYKAYRFGATEKGMTASGVSENPANQLLHKVWRITVPDTTRPYWTHPYIAYLYGAELIVGWGYGSVFPLQPRHTVDLYRAAATLDGPTPFDFLALDTSATAWNMRSNTYRLSPRGDSVYALGPWKVREEWAAAIDTIPVMFAPPRWNGHLLSNASYRGVFSDGGEYGLFPSQTGDEAHPYGETARLFRAGQLIAQDSVRGFGAVGFYRDLSDDAYVIEVNSAAYHLPGGLLGHATATLDFDGRRADNSPPWLARMQFMAGGTFVDAVYPGIDVQLRLQLRDTSAISKVAVALRPHGDSAWVNVPLTAEGEDRLAHLPVDGTRAIDVRIEAADAAGNSMRYVMEPALGASSPPPAQLSLGSTTYAPGDTLLTQSLAMANQVPVGRLGYTLTYSDPLALLRFADASPVGRAAGLRSAAQWNAGASAVTGALDDPAGRGIAAGSGPVLEHHFRVQRDTASARRLLTADTTVFTIGRPADPDRATRRLSYHVASRADLVDLGGVVPLAGIPGPGTMDLALPPGDLDADGRVTDADVLAVASNVFQPRLAGTGFLLADLYPDGFIDVYDVVRTARLAAGLTAVDTTLPHASVVAACAGCPAARPSARFSVAADAERYRVRFTPGVPIAGMQLMVRYDSTAVRLGDVVLDAPAGFRLISYQPQADVLTVLIYSVTATALPTSDVALFSIQAITRRPGALGSALTLEHVQLAGPDGRAIPAGNPHFDGLDAPIAAATALGEPFPNPFSSLRPIHVPIDVAGSDAPRVRAVVYGIRGERIRTLLDDVVPAGHHVVDWDGKNDRGDLVSSGIYILLVEGPGLSMRRRLVFVR